MPKCLVSLINTACTQSSICTWISDLPNKLPSSSSYIIAVCYLTTLAGNHLMLLPSPSIIFEVRNFNSNADYQIQFYITQITRPPVTQMEQSLRRWPSYRSPHLCSSVLCWASLGLWVWRNILQICHSWRTALIMHSYKRTFVQWLNSSMPHWSCIFLSI